MEDCDVAPLKPRERIISTARDLFRKHGIRGIGVDAIVDVAGTNKSACIQNGVRTFPTWSGQPAGTWYGTSTPSAANVAPCPTVGTIGAGAISNAAYVKSKYNTADTRGGRAALNAALASCASGLAAVNIDNGFGAAHAALRILGEERPPAAP